MNTNTAQNASKSLPQMVWNKSALRSAPTEQPIICATKQSIVSSRMQVALLLQSFCQSHRQQQCFPQISAFDLSRETSAFSSLIIALESAYPSAEAVALPNHSVDLAAESFPSSCKDSNSALIPLVTGLIFRNEIQPVRQPSPSLDSAFPRHSHSCLPSN